MSIIRAARKSQFYTLPTATIDDDRLSWEARGLLIYLLSKPDHWMVQVKDLINRTRNAIGKSSGRDKVYTILNELRAAGYIIRSFQRCGGNFTGIEYEVAETADLEAGAEYVRSIEQKGRAPFPENTETDSSAEDSPSASAPFTSKPETLDSTESAIKIEKAVKPTTDPLDEKTDQDQGADIDSTLPADYPSDYPGPASSIFRAWRAYALAIRERYKLWPVYNSKVGGLMGKAVVRIQAATPAAVTHFVKLESAPSLVDKLHPVTAFLMYCESYAVKAELAAQSKKRADRAAVAVQEAERASASAPQANENTKSTPSPASAGAAALSALKTRVGIPSK